MDVFLPRTLPEALSLKAAHPEAVPIAGGTDLMVDMNFDRQRPDAFVDLSRLGELAGVRRDEGRIFLGAGVTYTRIIRDLPDLPYWRQAARTVGSPQIRNRGTIGGNLGTASPAGDALPVLAALDAEVMTTSAMGDRALPWDAFLVGVKQTALRPDELIRGVRWKPVQGPGSFSKIGSRNAMVISVASICLVLDEDARRLRVALGSVGPRVIRAYAAEAFASRALERTGAWDDPREDLPPSTIDEFAERVSGEARPIDDVRGTAAYRRRACSVLAGRALSWAMQDRRAGT